jgi:hypothetical protein
MNQSDIKSAYIPTKTTLKPILFSLLILVSGIIIGAGLTLIVTGNSATQKTMPPGPEYMSSRMVNRIVRELKLSPQQHELLKPIVQKHMKAMEDVRQEARPKISAEIKQMNEEIASILNDRQKEIWQDNIKRMRERFNQMRRHRNPGDRQRGGNDRDSRPWHDRRHQDDQINEPPLPPGENPPLGEKSPPPDDF